MTAVGEKNRLLQFWSPTGAKNAANEPLPDAFLKTKEKWASILSQTGMASVRAAATADGIKTDIAQYSFRVNYDLSLTTSMQVRDRDTRYRVIGVRHDRAMRQWTDVICEEDSVYGKPSGGS